MGTRYLALGAAVMLLAPAACAGPRGGASSTSAQPTGRAITGLVYAYGVGARNVLDTTRGTFTKDMISASPITIPLILSAKDMARISKKMDKIGFSSYPSAFTPAVAEGGGEMAPFATYRFVARTDAGTKVVVWADKFATDDKRALRLRSLARLIERLIVATPEYKRLPEAEGGYL
jgi:hypothetical protein